MSSDNQNQGESGAPKTVKRKVKSAVTNNPYLNFMRDFRLKNKGLNVVEQTIKGADMWRKMSESQREPYVELARQARSRRKQKCHKGQKRRRRSKCRGRRHSMDTDY